MLEILDQVVVLELTQLERLESYAVRLIHALPNSSVKESARFILGNFKVAHQQNCIVFISIIVDRPKSKTSEMYYNSVNNSQILYAENCPEEPLVFDNPFFPRSSNKKQKKRNIPLKYQPHILKNSPFLNTHNDFTAIQHGRELSCLQMRIRDCKSLCQRKKDHNDPIIYPAYFRRDNKKSKDARIDGYFRKIVFEKRKTKKRSMKPKQVSQLQGISFIRNAKQLQSAEVRIPLPALPTKPSGSQYDNLWVRELPNCHSQQISSYIVKKQLYFESDLMVLRNRLIHYYGEEAVKPVWKTAIQQLSK